MTTELGRQLIYAFANGQEGGSPSYVIATEGLRPELAQECIEIAKDRNCEVTHIHFHDKPNQASLRFYVSSGAISFCGHGALAAMAWAYAKERATKNLALDYGSGQLNMQTPEDGRFGFIDSVGNWKELPLNQDLLLQIAALLGLETLSEGVRVCLGGQLRKKAMIKLPSRVLLGEIKIHPYLRDQFCHQQEVTGVYPFALPQDGVIAARHFSLNAGFEEDMATGNIASTIAALASEDMPRAFSITQGGPLCLAACLSLQPLTNGSWFVGGTCRHID